ncbi:uncharacterized protein [Penaeus vannamei]|uniref:uncharacterized protein n=1 Tax=Penaeus vannamei TaxID=6689 RepID=UPI00387FB11E
MSPSFVIPLSRPSSLSFTPTVPFPGVTERPFIAWAGGNVTILPSNKGNSVVVLARVSYPQKARDLLDDATTDAPLTSDSWEHIPDTFHRRLKELVSCFLEANLYQRFNIINLRLPHTYWFPKPKSRPAVPLRPIISSRGSATHPLVDWLAESLTPLLGTFSPAHRHSQDFIPRVRGVSSATMMSLDIDSLFTKVPLDDVLNFHQRKLTTEDARLPLPTDIFQLIRLCVGSNSFSFESRSYSQTFTELSPSIRFKVEREVDNKLSFLKLLFIALLTTSPSLYIGNLCTVIDFLRRSFSKLGYPRHIFDVASSRARRTFYNDFSPKETSHLSVLSLLYTEICSLRRPMQPLNCRLTFRQVNTLHNLVHTFPPYAVPCASCDKQYFNKTCASLIKRLYQQQQQRPLTPSVGHRPSDGLESSAHCLPFR